MARKQQFLNAEWTDQFTESYAKLQANEEKSADRVSLAQAYSRRVHVRRSVVRSQFGRGGVRQSINSRRTLPSNTDQPCPGFSH